LGGGRERLISLSSLDRLIGELTRPNSRLSDITEISRVEHAMSFELKRPDHRPAPLDVLRFKLALLSQQIHLVCFLFSWRLGDGAEDDSQHQESGCRCASAMN